MRDWRKFPRTALGRRDARFVLVGEAPGIASIENGRQWTGAGGMILRREIRRLGLDLEDLFYLTNAVKCWPAGRARSRQGRPGNRSPLATEARRCQPVSRRRDRRAPAGGGGRGRRPRCPRRADPANPSPGRSWATLPGRWARGRGAPASGEREQAPERVADLPELAPRALRRAGRARRLPGGGGGGGGHRAAGPLPRHQTRSGQASRRAVGVPGREAGARGVDRGLPRARARRGARYRHPRWESGSRSCRGPTPSGGCSSTSSEASSPAGESRHGRASRSSGSRGPSSRRFRCHRPTRSSSPRSLSARPTSSAS